MKTIPAFLLFAALFAACKKNDSGNDCRLSEVKVLNSGSLQQTTTYQYDAQGRITKEISNGIVNDYVYYADSVVINKGGQSRMVYYLDGTGRADSAKVRYTQTTNVIGLDYKYTYDASGYLIGSREIFSQIYNGSLLFDTTLNVYTIVNGNLVTASSTQWVSSEHYEYTTYPMTLTDVDMRYFPSGGQSFLGKPSRFFPLQAKDDAGQVIAAYSYNFDGAGRIKKLTSSFPGGLVNTTEFRYQCN